MPLSYAHHYGCAILRQTANRGRLPARPALPPVMPAWGGRGCRSPSRPLHRLAEHRQSHDPRTAIGQNGPKSHLCKVFLSMYNHRYLYNITYSTYGTTRILGKNRAFNSSVQIVISTGGMVRFCHFWPSWAKSLRGHGMDPAAIPPLPTASPVNRLRFGESITACVAISTVRGISKSHFRSFRPLPYIYAREQQTLAPKKSFLILYPQNSCPMRCTRQNINRTYT